MHNHGVRGGGEGGRGSMLSLPSFPFYFIFRSVQFQSATGSGPRDPRLGDFIWQKIGKNLSNMGNVLLASFMVNSVSCIQVRSH